MGICRENRKVAGSNYSRIGYISGLVGNKGVSYTGVVFIGAIFPDSPLTASKFRIHGLFGFEGLWCLGLGKEFRLQDIHSVGLFGGGGFQIHRILVARRHVSALSRQLD